jgi:hypothetical protein
MSLVEFMVRGAQRGYELEVEKIARHWDALLGQNALEPFDEGSFVDQVIGKLETGGLPDGTLIQVISDLMALSWWRGLTISDRNAGRIFHCAANCFENLASQINFPTRNIPQSKARQNHCVFVGTLQDPGHSPSGAAIDYIASLALNENVNNIAVYYSGEISDRLQVYLDNQIKPRNKKCIINFINNTLSDDLIGNLYNSEKSTFHIMCEPHLSPIISILNFIGPTIMFICSEEIPFQYSDVYWFTKDKEYIKKLWEKRGAPKSLIENYEHIKTYPSLVERPAAPRSRRSLSIADDAFVIATVGNRLGIDLDEAFVTGMEATLKRHPSAVWLVVGDLPDNLLYACHTVMESQFRYVRFEIELNNLLAIADVFANPFRPGGGGSSHIALAARCVVLSLGSGGVGALIPGPHRAQDSDDYFTRLDKLASDPAYLDDCRSQQQVYFGSIADSDAFSKELFTIVDLAHSRFRKRLGMSLSDLVYGPRGDQDVVSLTALPKHAHSN